MSATPARLRFPALGTTAVVAATDDTMLATAGAVVVAEIAAVDVACSRFRPDSDLMAVNGAHGRPVAVSPLFADALGVALRAAEITGGLVDPTVGAALRVVGYDRDFAMVSKHGGTLVARVERVPGWQTVQVDARARTVVVPNGVQLDLGATAKAWCADRAARTAAEATGAGILVSLGGDVATAGAPPAGGWIVLVADDHAASVDAPGATMSVASGGLATSSTTVRRWRRGGVQLHHVIDPGTGWPAAGPWRTVTVAAASCLDANVAATAAIVLGAEAIAWLDARRLPSRLVSDDGSISYVAGWPAAACLRAGTQER
jgi:thiamine biosynthesis lipoprotein